jgi:hypothetical protein
MALDASGFPGTPRARSRGLSLLAPFGLREVRLQVHEVRVAGFQLHEVSYLAHGTASAITLLAPRAQFAEPPASETLPFVAQTNPDALNLICFPV